MANNNDKYKNHSREELIDELETLKKKKYGLVWDKKNSQEMLDAFVNWENVPENFTPKQFPVLKEVKNKEIKSNKDKPVNLLIEGDNYHSLAVLNFTHQNSIDVIYIDPPYNTGNKDFVFNDNYVDKEDSFRHSKWLSFMSKRLELVRGVLKDDGIFFISIDNNEIAQLKMLCDEIFDEDNFVNIIVWKKTNSPKAQANTLGNQHEYILVYAKNINKLPINKFSGAITENYKETFSHDDNDGKGPYQTVALVAGGSQRSERRKAFDFRGITDQWLYKKETLEKFWNDKRIYKTAGGKFRLKKYLNETEGRLLSDLWVDDEIKPLQGGSSEYTGFLTQKPLSLINRIIKLYDRNNAIILDFFAGSGTTGESLIDVNKQDNGNRKFILCTYNKENNNGKVIDEYCYPRLKKSISSVGGNLKYFKTDFVGSDSTDKNKRDLVNKSAEMICIKEDVFNLVADGGLDYRIYQKGKKFLGIIFDLDAIADFKKEAEKHKGNFVVYCFSYTEATPEKEFKGLKNKYVLKPIPAVILRIYLEIFKK